MEVGRFRSVEVFSTFPMEFFVSNSNLVPGDLVVGSKSPQKAILTKPWYMEVGRFRSVEVFSTFPMEFFVSNSNLVPGDLAIGSKSPKRAILTKPLYMEVGQLILSISDLIDHALMSLAC
jgi:hypothetical protein